MGMRAVAAYLALMVTMTGCLSVKSYVDPQLPKVGYGDLLARPDPRPVVLTVAFHRNPAAPPRSATLSRTISSWSTVTDGYVMTATFRGAATPAVTKVYRHAIHSTVGNADGPSGLVAEASPRAAFDKVVEGLVLTLLLDLQKEERI